MTNSPILEVSNLYVSYGPFRALFGVSFSVPEGEAVALIGPNGAGKSTIARAISGLVPCTSGTVRFRDRDITGMPAWRIARLGMAHAPEGRAVFASLTVEENLSFAFSHSAGKPAIESALRDAYAAFPRLAERRTQLANTLSGGEQRMLALARVLAVPPRLLVVDELSLGLAPVMVDEVFGALRAIQERGTSIVVVEQQVGRALALAGHAVVLSKGTVVFAGASSEVDAGRWKLSERE